MNDTRIWIEPMFPVSWLNPLSWIIWLFGIPQSRWWQIMENRSDSSYIFCRAVCKNKREAEKKLRELQ